MIKSFALVTLVAGLAFSGFAMSSSDEVQSKECCATLAECPVAKKVDGLLVRWDAAAKEAESATPAAQAAFQTKIADLCQKCPVGGRLDGAFKSVNNVLGFVVTSAETNAANCPLEKSGDMSEACVEGKQMMAARMQMLTKLHKLASFAAGPDCEKACGAECAEGCTTACTASADKMAANCPIRMASRIGSQKESFVAARREASQLSVAARGEILAGFASLSKSSKAIALVPESLIALTEGFEALNHLHTKMGEWAQANPQLLSSMPASAHMSYMMELALIDEARGLLTEVGQAMQAMQSQTAATAMATGTAK